MDLGRSPHWVGLRPSGNADLMDKLQNQIMAKDAHSSLSTERGVQGVGIPGRNEFSSDWSRIHMEPGYG